MQFPVIFFLMDTSIHKQKNKFIPYILEFGVYCDCFDSKYITHFTWSYILYVYLILLESSPSNMRDLNRFI
jgi:hypothetical protein